MPGHRKISGRIGSASLLASTVAGFLFLVNLFLANTGTFSRLPEALFVEVPNKNKFPTMSLKSMQAPNGEWLLHIETRNFVFTELCVNRTEGTQSGHAHVHKGERKIGTAYAPVFSLGRLAPGRHQFLVMLRAQDHRAVVGSDGLILEEITVTMPVPRGYRRLS